MGKDIKVFSVDSVEHDTEITVTYLKYSGDESP